MPTRLRFLTYVSSLAVIGLMLWMAGAYSAHAAPPLQDDYFPTHLNATAATRAFVMSAPSDNSALVEEVPRRGVLFAFGRDAACEWIHVITPASEVGWVLAEDVTLDGDCDELDDHAAASRNWQHVGTSRVTGFDDFDWFLGDPPNGEFVQTDRNTYEGEHAGTFLYNLPHEEGGVMFAAGAHPIPGDPLALFLWVDGDGSGLSLEALFDDADGNLWDVPLGEINHTGWRPMMGRMDFNGRWAPYLVRGDDSRGIIYPITLSALLLGGMPEGQAPEGTITVDDIHVVGMGAGGTAAGSGPSVRATPTRRATPATGSGASARATPTRRGNPAAGSGPTARATPTPHSVPGGSTAAGSGDPSWAFWADSETISAGECTTLYWYAGDVFAVAFHEEDTNADQKDSREVCPDATTDYYLYIWPDLMASLKREEAIYETVTVNVVEPGDVVDEGAGGGEPQAWFWADDEALAPGDCTTIYWQTEDAKAVWFDGDDDWTDLNGERQVCPTETAEYTLWFYSNEDEEFTQQLTITVDGAAGDDGVGEGAGDDAADAAAGGEPAWYFWPDPELIRAGECTTVYWQTENVWGVWFDNDEGWADLSGSREVCPTETTEYTLYVYPTKGEEVTVHVTVMVEGVDEGDEGARGDNGADDDGNNEDGGDVDAGAEANWKIDADRRTITAGECTVVYWETSGVADVWLDFERVGASGEREVCPTKTETFILGIWLADGSDRTDWVTVEVRQEGE